MFPIGLEWEKIKAKEGDDISLSLSPSETALVFGMLVNVSTFPEMINGATDDSDVFDDRVSKLLAKFSQVVI